MTRNMDDSPGNSPMARRQKTKGSKRGSRLSNNKDSPRKKSEGRAVTTQNSDLGPESKFVSKEGSLVLSNQDAETKPLEMKQDEDFNDRMQ